MFHINGSLPCQIAIKYVEGFVDKRENAFMAICNFGFIMDIYIGQNQNCLTIFGESFLCRISIICETVCGKHIKVQLWPYVNQALLWIRIYFAIIS
jgi:hypothetical protein